MSSDLLAEFDTFYKSPQDTQPKPTASGNNSSFFDGSTSSSQSWQAGTTGQAPAQAAKQNDDPWGDWGSFSSPPVSAQPGTPQDDPWGAFGITAMPSRPNSHVYNSNSDYQGGNIFKNDNTQPKPGVLRRSTFDLFNNNVMDMPEPPTVSNNQAGFISRPVMPPSMGSSGGEILFDADNMSQPDDDDDFGEFESVTTPPPQAPPPSQPIEDFFGSMTLQAQPVKGPSNLMPTIPNAKSPLPYPQAPKSPSFQERNPFPTVGLATAQVKQVTKIKNQDKPKSASPATPWPTYDEKPPKAASKADQPATEDIDDDWGDFADLPAESPVVEAIPKQTSGIAADAWAWDNADQVIEHAPPEPNLPPPTNIPPPSILLALFPQLFDLPQSSLFKAVANQPFSLKNRIMSDPSTINFLRAYILIATVAAHILAGRKFRWKRDTHLSQAMKIGPAGRKGGMKLTGVDKAEVAREDREAAETIRVWKEQLGRLRSAVAAANTSLKDPSKHLIIPEIGETMQVKSEEGGLTAPKACIICGLKREERVKGVDVKVEDSFGEWWIEFWGHRLCRNFWQEHEGKLRFQ